MWITRVSAVNFMGYSGFDVSLEMGPFCVTGPNMSGKSTFTRSIFWTLTGRFPYPNLRWTKDLVMPGKADFKDHANQANHALNQLNHANHALIHPGDASPAISTATDPATDLATVNKKSKGKGGGKKTSSKTSAASPHSQSGTISRCWFDVPSFDELAGNSQADTNAGNGVASKTDRYEVTRILLDDKMTLVVRDFDGHEWTGDVAQDLIFNLAGIPNTGSVGDRINSFTRLFWLGVGQQTGFFEAQGRERKKIIEGITPFKKLASMEKEVAVRIKVHAAKAEEYAEEASASKGVARTLRAELFKAIPASLMPSVAPGGESSESKDVRGRIEAATSGLPSREKIAGMEESLRVDISRLSGAAAETDRIGELARAAEKNEAEVASTLGGRTQADVEAEVGEFTSLLDEAARLSAALKEERMEGRELRARLASAESELSRATSDADRLARTEAARGHAAAFLSKVVEVCDHVGSPSRQTSAHFPYQTWHQAAAVDISLDLIESQMRDVKNSSRELIARCEAAGFIEKGPATGDEVEGLLEGLARVLKAGVPEALAKKALDMETEAEAERERVVGKTSSLARLENETARAASLRTALEAGRDTSRRLEVEASDAIALFADGAVAAMLAAVVAGHVEPDSLKKITQAASGNAGGLKLKSLKGLIAAGAGLELRLAQIADSGAMESAWKSARETAVAGAAPGERYSAYVASASALVRSALDTVVADMDSSATTLAELRAADAENAAAVEAMGGELAVARSQRDARRRDTLNLEKTIKDLGSTAGLAKDPPYAGDAAKAPACGHCGAPLSEGNLTKHLEEARTDLAMAESKVSELESRLANGREEKTIIKEGLTEASEMAARGDAVLAGILEAAEVALGQFDIISSNSTNPTNSINSHSTATPKLGLAEDAAFLLASVVEGGVNASLDPLVARMEALAVDGEALGKQLTESEAALSGLMVDFFGKDSATGGASINGSALDASRVKDLVQGLSRTIQAETEVARARVASLKAAASQLTASSETIRAMTDRTFSSAARHLAALTDETSVAKLAGESKKSRDLVQGKMTEKATLGAALAKLDSSEIKRESLGFLGLQSTPDAGLGSSQDEELRILGLLDTFSSDVAAEVQGHGANLKKVAEKTAAARMAREAAKAASEVLLRDFATTSRADLERAAESKRAELEKVLATAEAAKVRDNLLRLAAETVESEARVDLYVDMAQTENEELESLQVIKGILAPNGDARTLAVADTVALVVAETNRSLRSLDLAKNLSIDLKLEKDEDGQPTIETHFQVDGDSSGKILPSESQRMIVGICVDLAVRDLLTKDSFIIIDEPETGLDDEVKRKFMNFLKAASRQVVFVTNTASAGLERIMTTADIRKTMASKKDEIEAMAKNAKELARRGTGEKRSTSAARKSKQRIPADTETTGGGDNETNDQDSAVRGSDSVDDGEI